MKSYIIALFAMAAASGTVLAETSSPSMVISPAKDRPAVAGPVAVFTGKVQITPLLAPHDPASKISAGSVAFQPGARSAWHTHPAGQALFITSGTGWVQEWNGKKQLVKAGDVIWTPPGVKHWHGATADTAMSHTAVQETIDGKNVEWMEKVSDAQYTE